MFEIVGLVANVVAIVGGIYAGWIVMKQRGKK